MAGTGGHVGRGGRPGGACGGRSSSTEGRGQFAGRGRSGAGSRRWCEEREKKRDTGCVREAVLCVCHLVVVSCSNDWGLVCVFQFLARDLFV